MAYLIRKGLVALKVEATPYTYLWGASDPLTADLVFPAFDAKYDASGSEMYSRPETIAAGFGHLDDTPSTGRAKLSFSVLLCGASAAGTAPFFGAALKACGMSETVVPATSVTYKPTTTYTSQQSFSLLYMEDGIAYGISGAMGNVKISCEVGKPAILQFEFEGAYPDDPRAVTAPTPSSTLITPPVFTNAGLSLIPSWTGAEFEKLEIDLGAKLADIKDANTTLGSNGFKGKLITDREITGTVDPTFVAPGTKAVWEAWRAGTTGAIGTGVIGSAAGNKWQISMARCQYASPSMEDRNGFRANKWSFKAKVASDAADGADFSLIFT